MIDRFNELLNTLLDNLEKQSIGVSSMYTDPTLRYLNEMADAVTITRCLKKLAAERRALVLRRQR